MSSEKCATAEKTFVCFICEKEFSRKFSYNRHCKVVHFGIKPHWCVCGKSFANQEQIKAHMASKHSSQKPFECEKGCDKRFASYSARSYHHKIYHDRLGFECDFEGCCAKFSSKQILRNHIKRTHSYHQATTDRHSNIKDSSVTELEMFLSYFIQTGINILPK